MKLLARRAFILLPILALASCAAKPGEIGREPEMSRVGGGVERRGGESAALSDLLASAQSPGGGWSDSGAHLFRDSRARRPGDILTIDISIDDRATLGNQTNRSKEAKIASTVDYLFNVLGLTTSGGANYEINSNSSTNGKGNVQRSERIKMSLAAVVVKSFGNGNIMISGSQEIRVNQELRVLQVEGIAKVEDISKDNRIAYDKIAEARVSYGGRGRLSEVQQPQVGQQIYDLVRPF